MGRQFSKGNISKGIKRTFLTLVVCTVYVPITVVIKGDFVCSVSVIFLEPLEKRHLQSLFHDLKSRIQMLKFRNLSFMRLSCKLFVQSSVRESERLKDRTIARLCDDAQEGLNSSLTGPVFLKRILNIVFTCQQCW